MTGGSLPDITLRRTRACTHSPNVEKISFLPSEFCEKPFHHFKSTGATKKPLHSFANWISLLFLSGYPFCVTIHSML